MSNLTRLLKTAKVDEPESLKELVRELFRLGYTDPPGTVGKLIPGFTVSCAGKGCFEVLYRPLSAVEMRGRLRQEGWREGKKLWVCPYCTNTDKKPFLEGLLKGLSEDTYVEWDPVSQGDRTHYGYVYSNAFKGLGMIERQEVVFACLGRQRGLNLFTLTHKERQELENDDDDDDDDGVWE